MNALQNIPTYHLDDHYNTNRCIFHWFLSLVLCITVKNKHGWWHFIVQVIQKGEEHRNKETKFSTLNVHPQCLGANTSTASVRRRSCVTNLFLLLSAPWCIIYVRRGSLYTVAGFGRKQYHFNEPLHIPAGCRPGTRPPEYTAAASSGNTKRENLGNSADNDMEEKYQLRPSLFLFPRCCLPSLPFLRIWCVLRVREDSNVYER